MEQFITWYCSEPRLALDRTVVLRFRVYLESLGLAAGTVNQRLAAVKRLAFEAADSGLLKFGVPHPDYLALVGDSADGYPGLTGWGAKSTSAVLAKFGHIESIPVSAQDWHLNVLNSLAATLARERKLALLFRTLATLRSDIPLFDNVDSLLWSGPSSDFDAMGRLLDKAVIERESKPKPGTSPVRGSGRAIKSRKI